MAFVSSLPEQNRGVGNVRGVALAAPASRHALIARLASAARAWENGAITALGWERSTDNGASWQVMVIAYPPFGLDKDGNPPSVGWRPAQAEEGVQYRPFVTLERTARIGVDVEVR